MLHLVSNSSSLPNKPQATSKPTSLSTLELLQYNFDSKEEAFKYLVEFMDKNDPKVVQHKQNMKQLKIELVKEKM